MLKSWGLTNFKSIYNADLKLAPLTVLTGTNSSGKSSFIQSILLIAQTMQNKYKEFPLILNGQYVNFGKFDDIMSFHPDGKNGQKSVPIGFQWTCNYNDKKAMRKDRFYYSYLDELNNIDETDDEYDAETEVKFCIEYDTNNNESYSGINRQILPRLKSVNCYFDTIYEKHHVNNKFEVDYDIIVELFRVYQKIFIEACDPYSLNEYPGQKIRYKFGTSYVRIPDDDDLMQYHDVEIMDDEMIKLFTFPINNAEFFHFFPMKILFSIEKDGKIINRWKDLLGMESQTLPLGMESETILKGFNDSFLSKFIYIGPLREEPKQLYPLSEFSYMPNFGKKGENTVAILALNRNKIDNFPTPDLSDLGEYIFEEKSLIYSVIEWLSYIGVAEDINVNIGPGGFDLKIKTPKSNHFNDLTNVGVGVSQVIPIVVSCLFADKGSTLIFEQPELHLHPKMQTKLTDFFVAISQSGKQCIIETHSEHIINALRYRVAKTSSPYDEKLIKDMQIYFSTKDDKEGTIFTPINIDKYSTISEWPEDFFDESSKTADEIIKAVSKKWKENEDNES